MHDSDVGWSSVSLSSAVTVTSARVRVAMAREKLFSPDVRGALARVTCGYFQADPYPYPLPAGYQLMFT